MIICIVGKTSSGKDSVARILKEKYGINMVVSYSTATKRDDQIEGVHHYFISGEEMNKLRKESTVITYDKTESGVEYCATLESIKEDKVVYIINPAGVKYLRDNNMDIRVIYVDCSDREILVRGSKRGDGLMRLSKRLNEETTVYNDFHRSGNWDYVIDNNGSFESLVKQVDSIVAKII